MNLNYNEWKPFKLGSVFIIKYGVNLELNACDEVDDKSESDVNFVSRTAENNGVSSRVAIINGVAPQKAGLISIAGGGSVLSTFLQDEPFYSGRDLYTLEEKEDLSDEAKLFIITIIEQNKYKYSYGRQANKTMPEIELILPIQYNADGIPFIDESHQYSDEGYVPDWQLMEDYIKSLNHKPLTTNNKDKTIIDLNFSGWKEFQIGSLFLIEPTTDYKGMSNDDLDDGGKTPFVVNSSVNNGIGGFSSLEATEKKGIITFSDTTDSNTFFYQPEDFIGFAHVQGMYPKHKEWSRESLLFLVSLLQFSNKGLFNYGRKMRRDTISASYIKLPVRYNADGTIFIDKTHIYCDEGYVPDWRYMENYIKSLPYGDRLEK